MPAPSKQTIEAEIVELAATKVFVPERNYFGQDNHEAINACLDVLTQRLTEDDVYSRGSTEDEEEDDSKWPPHVTDQALHAARWLTGENDEAPSAGWQHLKK